MSSTDATGEEIATLRRDEPRRFDALVAERVHGWLRFGTNTPEGIGWYWLDHPEPQHRFGPYRGDKPNELLLTTAASAGRKLYADAMRPVPMFATYTSDDYATLKLVAEDWSAEQQMDWGNALGIIWRDRKAVLSERRECPFADELLYLIGDWSEAALRVAPASPAADAGSNNPK